MVPGVRRVVASTVSNTAGVQASCQSWPAVTHHIRKPRLLYQTSSSSSPTHGGALCQNGSAATLSVWPCIAVRFNLKFNKLLQWTAHIHQHFDCKARPKAPLSPTAGGCCVWKAAWCCLRAVVSAAACEQPMRCGISAGHAVLLGLLEARRLAVCTRAHSPTRASADTCWWQTHQTVTSRTIILRHTKQPLPPVRPDQRTMFLPTYQPLISPVLHMQRVTLQELRLPAVPVQGQYGCSDGTAPDATQVRHKTPPAHQHMPGDQRWEHG